MNKLTLPPAIRQAADELLQGRDLRSMSLNEREEFISQLFDRAVTHLPLTHR